MGRQASHAHKRLSIWEPFLFCSMTFIVYAIRSKTRNYTYIGMSAELEVRIKRHNDGKNKTTRAYAPFYLIYTKPFETRAEARNHEKYLKTGRGRAFLKSIKNPV